MLNQEALRAVLFDLDGTLMDTDDQAVEALARRMAKLRLADPQQKARRLIMASETPGNALMTLLDMVGLDGTLTRATDQLRRWRGLQTRDKFRVIRGVEAMLDALKGRYRLAVVTTRGAREADIFLRQHNLGHFFETVSQISSSETLPRQMSLISSDSFGSVSISAISGWSCRPKSFCQRRTHLKFGVFRITPPKSNKIVLIPIPIFVP